jgi:predicted metallopeptidase
LYGVKPVIRQEALAISNDRKSTMLKFIRLPAAAIFALLSSHTVAGGTEIGVSCGDAVYVSSTDAAAVQLVCEAVEEARILNAACGLQQTRPIVIEIVFEMDPDHKACAAYFDCKTDKLTILSVDALAASENVISVFRNLSAEAYFRSVIIHEMTHAFLNHSGRDGFSRVAHEYLAYAIQIASLDDTDRETVRSTSTVLSGDLERINESLLIFGPSQFALRSYQHFALPKNGCTFVGRILDADPTLPEPFLGNSEGLIP